jgi:predicted permease
MGIFETVFPILAIVLAGYWAAYSKHLSENDCDSISTFVFTYIIPMLLFIGTAKANIPDNMEWEFLFSYYAALLIVYLLSIILGKLIFGFSISEQSVFGMGSSYSNATIIGIPVCMYVLGEKSLLPLFIIISIHNLILFTIGICVVEFSKFSISSFLQNLREIFKQLITSPITASLIIGGLVNILNIPIYKPLDVAITLMSQAAVPTALFALGASLNKYKVQGHIAPILLMVTLKIAFFPLLVWILAFKVFTIDPLWASTALLTSAMPVGISAYIFSHKYKKCEALIATAILVSTLGSILTLSVLLLYVHSII